MTNSTYICDICSSFISEDEIAFRGWRSNFSNEFFYLCDVCCADVDEDDDDYALISAGWGTDEDYGYYGE